MTRIRALSVLVLILSMLGVGFAWAQFVASLALGWFLASLAGGIMTVSSILLVFLAIFSINVADDGSYLIDRKSLYGRLFLKYMLEHEQLSLCQIFRQINFTLIRLVAICIVVGGVVAFVTGSGIKIVSFFIIGLIGTLLAAYGITHIIRKIAEPIDAWLSRYSRNKRITLGSGIAALSICAVVGFCIALFGYANTVWGAIVALKFLGMVIASIVIFVIALCLCIAIVSAGKWILQHISGARFASVFDSLYHTYACPRIRVQ